MKERFLPFSLAILAMGCPEHTAETTITKEDDRMEQPTPLNPPPTPEELPTAAASNAVADDASPEPEPTSSAQTNPHSETASPSRPPNPKKPEKLPVSPHYEGPDRDQYWGQ